jgi:hypothetical protein
VDDALRMEEVKHTVEMTRTPEVQHAGLDSLAKGP